MHLPIQKTQETWVWSLGWEVPLEEEIVTHSIIPAWKIPWTEESAGLQSMGPQSRIWPRDWAHTHTHTHIMHVNIVLSTNSQFFQRQRACALSSSCINTRTVSTVQCLSGDSVLPQGTITNCSVMETPLKVQLYPLNSTTLPPWGYTDIWKVFSFFLPIFFHLLSLLRMRLKEILKLEST